MQVNYKAADTPALLWHGDYLAGLSAPWIWEGEDAQSGRVALWSAALLARGVKVQVGGAGRAQTADTTELRGGVAANAADTGLPGTALSLTQQLWQNEIANLRRLITEQMRADVTVYTDFREGGGELFPWYRTFWELGYGVRASARTDFSAARIVLTTPSQLGQGTSKSQNASDADAAALPPQLAEFVNSGGVLVIQHQNAGQKGDFKNTAEMLERPSAQSEPGKTDKLPAGMPGTSGVSEIFDPRAYRITGQLQSPQLPASPGVKLRVTAAHLRGALKHLYEPTPAPYAISFVTSLVPEGAWSRRTLVPGIAREIIVTDEDENPVVTRAKVAKGYIWEVGADLDPCGRAAIALVSALQTKLQIPTVTPGVEQIRAGHQIMLNHRDKAAELPGINGTDLVSSKSVTGHVVIPPRSLIVVRG
ncbi:MAG: hypothetical protein Q4A71_03555 [Actinomycetaceae bacterium]|nr:hypothetical protein [Actinomycetaceae bacterium]